MAYVPKTGLLPLGGAEDWKTWVEHPECFYCSAPLRPPLIYWVGVSGGIALHPACARTWITRLELDIYRSECDPK